MNNSLVKKLLFWCSLLGFIGFALGQKGINVSTFDLVLWGGSGIFIGAVLALFFYLLEKWKNKK